MRDDLRKQNNSTKVATPNEPEERGIDPNPFIILGFYCLCVFILKPWTLDFPLNDDWTYALGVRHLIQEGRIKICDMSSPSQILQLFWGALWMKLFGQSMGILKLSTLTTAALGTLFFHSTLKDLDVPAGARLPAALMLAASPLYFCLSFTFMTEVPYVCLMLLAFALYVKAEKNTSDSYLLAGSLAAAGSYLIRQTGLLIPLGYFSYLFFHHRLDRRKASILWGPPLLVAAGYGLWFHFVHGPTWASENVVFRRTLLYLSEGTWISQAVFRTCASTIFLGMCLCPISLGFLCFPGQFTGKKSPARMTLGIQAALTAYVMIMAVFLVLHGWMPHLENTLGRTGLGVLTVGGSAYKAAGIFGWNWIWIFATLASVASSSVGLAALLHIRAAAKPLEKAALHIFLLSSFGQFALTYGRDNFFDRYLLPLIPAAILACALCAVRWRWARSAAYAALAGLILFSWAGTSDYLAWNRAKWAAGRMGIEKGIAPGEIANGFDWDGYWTYEKNMERLKELKPLRGIGEWEWQTLNPHKAITSFRIDLSGLREIGRVPYRTPLSSQTQYIYLWSY